MQGSVEFFRMLADNACNYNVPNTIMFVGLVIIFSVRGTLFFADGCAFHIHGKQNLSKADWFRKCQAMTTRAFFFWSVMYIMVALLASVDFTAFIMTYIFAAMCAIGCGICLSLIYNIVWYAFVVPGYWLCRRRQK